MQGLERAKKSEQWRKDNGQFIPYPSTWLRAKGWEDEDAAPGQSSGPKFITFRRCTNGDCRQTSRDMYVSRCPECGCTMEAVMSKDKQ